MKPVNRSNTDDEYPLALQIELDKGWVIIWENVKQVYLGYGLSRKCWDYELNSFFKCVSGIQLIYPKNHSKNNDREKRSW